MDACPDGLLIGMVNPPKFGGGLKFSSSSALNKIECFLKVSERRFLSTNIGSAMACPIWEVLKQLIEAISK